ncbi:protein translocase subunit SecD [Lysobacter xinjiangensis]|uniref:Protein translocase subunit SecD n=1 Tax=Cognatilysobacter xinjiangensis TaxID=546892 RepID=A0ABQ3BUA6_9GAMM|nr:protein translocase subunit SecD [Lysobacter xinjiangensis]GGZ54735.1 protein translocase subunit SecD [Lysobacter xinjiangensis]
MLTFPRWKYFVILAVLVLSALYALPNLYQKDPSVQITGTGDAVVDDALRGRVQQTLQSARITPRAIEREDKSLLVRLNDPQVQTRAADLLRPLEADGYQVALSLASTVPDWLDAIGAKPMPLGLDLQGGVHFAMQIDQRAALNKRLDAYVEDIRAQLRDGGVPFGSVERDASNNLRVTLQSANDAGRAGKLLQQAYPSFVQQREGQQLTLAIPQAELNRFAQEAVEQNLTTLRNRVNSLGVAEPVVQRQGTDRIVIELPGLQDTAEAKRRIGAAATLEFRAVVGDENEAAAAVRDRSVPAGAKIYYTQNKQPLLLSRRVLVSGDQLVDARPEIDQTTGQPSVSIVLNSAGGKRMFDHTAENVGKRMATVYVEQVPITQMVDGKEVKSFRTEERVISAPTIQGVFGKNFQTTGLSQEEADSLAKQLKSGALAAPMQFVEERVIGPSLGADNVERGTRAVLYSFVFALAFFLVYYRMFGVITCLALLLNLLMVIAILSLPFIGATMSLPGFAGLALTVGMSVDANVLINERIREELRLGVPPQSAIAIGYDRASGTIFDANMTAMLAGIALLAFGTGPLKGFALTLIVGILTSVFTAVTVSRAMATLMYGGRRKPKSISI